MSGRLSDERIEQISHLIDGRSFTDGGLDGDSLAIALYRHIIAVRDDEECGRLVKELIRSHIAYIFLYFRDDTYMVERPEVISVNHKNTLIDALRAAIEQQNSTSHS